MKRHTDGFTIVELLIVIVTMGILLGIVFVGWSAVSTWSRDRARESDVQQWVSSFETYKGRFAVWPALPTGIGSAGAIKICLGTFTSTSAKCGQNTSLVPGQFIAASDSTTMLSYVGKVGNIPTNSSTAIKVGANSIISPYVYMSETIDIPTGVVTVTANFVGFFEAGCPSTSDWKLDTGSEVSSATSSAMLTNMGTSIKTCIVKKTLVYTPGS